jgi:hypothetical protein
VVTRDQQYGCANAGSDTLSLIIAKEEIAETTAKSNPPISLRIAECLAFDELGETLFVANGTQNAIAVFQFEPKKGRGC